MGPEEQKYLEELKQRHELAPERNSFSHSKFMINLQIEYMKEDIKERELKY